MSCDNAIHARLSEHRTIVLRSLFKRSLVGMLCSYGAIGTADAQLTRERIDAERVRIASMGWTFGLRESEATRYPISKLCGLKKRDRATSAQDDEGRISAGLPLRFDWREWHGATPIKHQLGCGSCWAFAVLGAMESIIRINDATSVDLSEQWLVSCTGAGDCNGGFYNEAILSLLCNGIGFDPCGDSGSVYEEDFPYVARDVSCGCPYEHPYCLSNARDVRSSTEEIKRAIYEHGPVVVGVDGDATSFQAYGEGVYQDCGGRDINHAVVLVGWDDAQGPAGIWFLRNSWGDDWGEEGYMRIPFGCSGVGDDPEYVEYADSDRAVWVDFGYSGSESGSFWRPYTSLQEGVTAVAVGGTVTVKAGSSTEELTISKRVTLVSAGGPATIGK